MIAQWGRFPHAEEFARFTVTLIRRIYGADDEQTGWALCHLGLALRDQGKFAEAEAALRESLGVFRRIYGPSDPRRQLITIRLLRTLKAGGKTVAIKPLLLELTNGCEAAVVKRPHDALALSRLAFLRAAASIDEFRNGSRALELAARAYALDRSEPDVLEALAAAHAEMGNFDLAVRYTEEAVTLITGSHRVRAQFESHLRTYRTGRPERWP